MNRFRSAAAALVLVAMPLGCKKDDKAGEAAAPKPPEVTTARVISREVTDYDAFTGHMDAVDTVDVRARVNGYLTEIHFTDGREVKQGDLLFQIDPRPFEAELKSAEGRKAQWVAKVARAKADVQRYEKLVPSGAATPQDLDKAKADEGEAVAAIQSAEASIDRAKLNLEFSRITAPLDGQIGRSLFSKGNLIRADADVLASIVALDPIYVNFDVDERTMLKFRQRAGASASTATSQPDTKDLNIPVFIGLSNEEGYPHQGVINFADNKVDPSTGTIHVRGTFDNSTRIFKPGLFARVRVPLSAPFKSGLVIDRAIGTDQGQKFVYLVDDKNVAQYRKVKLGRLEDDGLRVITEGVQPGDSVIVIGLQRARPGKPVTPQQIEMPSSKSGTESRPTASRIN